MPRDPVQQDGVWWLQQDDGSWIRWDETSSRWVDTKGAVVGMAPPATAGVAAPTYATPPASPTPSGAQKPRGKGPIYAVVGVVVLAIVAIAAFALGSGGSGDDNETTIGAPTVAPKEANPGTTSASAATRSDHDTRRNEPRRLDRHCGAGAGREQARAVRLRPERRQRADLRHGRLQSRPGRADVLRRPLRLRHRTGGGRHLGAWRPVQSSRPARRPP